jgi:hypothetical protein
VGLIKVDGLSFLVLYIVRSALELSDRSRVPPNPLVLAAALGESIFPSDYW